jgi:hypothetical protein
MKRAETRHFRQGRHRNVLSSACQFARKDIDVIGTYHSNKAEAAATASAIEALGRKAVMFQLNTGKASTFAPSPPT